jgi:4-hydroxybenzoate polyprenyltransferase
VGAGLIFPAGNYLHLRSTFSGKSNLSSKAIFAFIFLTIHYAAHAIFKDIPDLKGDMECKVKSFASVYGQKAVSKICVIIWLVNYACYTLLVVAVYQGIPAIFLTIKNIFAIQLIYSNF